METTTTKTAFKDELNRYLPMTISNSSTTYSSLGAAMSGIATHESNSVRFLTKKGVEYFIYVNGVNAATAPKTESELIADGYTYRKKAADVCIDVNGKEVSYLIDIDGIEGLDVTSNVVANDFYAFENWFDASESCNYKVIGDLLFRIYPVEDRTDVVVTRLDYTPGDYPLGDVMVETRLLYVEGFETWKIVHTWLRVKQSIDLTSMKYDYNDLFFLDVKGKDQDINFLGFTINLGKMKASGLDKMLKSVLFHIEFPDANTLSYTYTMGGNPETYSAPIEVEGHKLTVKMSERVPTLKDVVFYAYQDTNDSQMRLYVDRDAFVNIYTNMQAMLMIVENPRFDITNAETIDAIYNNINEVVENIDFCIIMK